MLTILNSAIRFFLSSYVAHMAPFLVRFAQAIFHFLEILAEHMTSSCSRLPSKTNCRLAGFVGSDILRLFELQKAPSSSSSSSEAEAEDPEATAEASPKATAEGEATDAAEASQVPDAQAEEVRSKASSPSEDMNAQEMEALFSNNGHVFALYEFISYILIYIILYYTIFMISLLQTKWGILKKIKNKNGLKTGLKKE